MKSIRTEIVNWMKVGDFSIGVTLNFHQGKAIATRCNRHLWTESEYNSEVHHLDENGALRTIPEGTRCHLQRIHRSLS